MPSPRKMGLKDSAVENCLHIVYLSLLPGLHLSSHVFHGSFLRWICLWGCGWE